MYNIFVPKSKTVLVVCFSNLIQIPISIDNPINILNDSIWNYVEHFDKNYFYYENGLFKFKRNFQAILSGVLEVGSYSSSNTLYLTNFNSTNNKFLPISYSIPISPLNTIININNFHFCANNNDSLGLSFITQDDIIINEEKYANLSIIVNNS